jgi:ATP-binding cassette, subfamily A (ABC1), member 3
MVLITYSSPSEISRNVNIANFVIALFAPSGSLLRSLLLTLNEFSLLCRDREVASYPAALTVYGGPILYLILQSVALLGFLVWWDSGWVPPFILRRSSSKRDIEEAESVEPDVSAESARVIESKDPLRVLKVSKSFGDTLAVRDVTFGVQRGEIFALLGPNGAGKSTTIGMIRGDVRPSDRNGDILVEDASIIGQRTLARSHLGVCPQFDAIDQMTVNEHLRFYARVRGAVDVEHNVEQVVQAIGLTPFQNRVAAKLSGGNKRKLSLGIALMGNPSVLLLDEPSSGMDAVSKRVLWRMLESVRKGRSLLLTTHSMEEADAIANRAGILAGKMLAVDNIDSLRLKHGDTYNVHLVHKDAPGTHENEMNKIKEWIKGNFPSAVVEDKSFHGQLRFNMPSSSRPTSSGDFAIEKGEGEISQTAKRNHGISAVFALLEAQKEELGFKYYSIAQSTLDQVFLNIVGKHNVEEENYARQTRKRKSFGMRLKKRLIDVFHNA